ncbi:MAG: hypothetical protein OSJ83_06950 [Clostridia bacterium]|nr:hypothetical protein [Clostridia bacterium]
MGWFNYYGLAVMAIIMIPNIVYAVKHKDDAADYYANKAVVVLEQLGRYGCFALMIFNIPYTYFGFWFDNALIVYLSVNGGLCIAYIACWIAFRNRHGMTRALSLSIIPSCIFLFSGIVVANIPLIVFSVIFAVNHILISCKNATKNPRRKKPTVEQKIKDEVIFIFVLVLVGLAVVGTIFGVGDSVFPLDIFVA